MRSGTAELAASVALSLEELARALSMISDQVYTDRGLDPAFGSCIGGHVRHVLDHARLLEAGVRSGTDVDYEARDRGSRVESDRAAAIDEAKRLAGAVSATCASDAPCVVMVKSSPTAPVLRLESSVSRELAFVSSHTIHHHAIIRVLLARAGTTIEDEFGLAHGTPRGRACAH